LANNVKVVISGENQFKKTFEEINSSFDSLKHAAESFLVGFGVERAIEGMAELTMKVVDSEVEFGKLAQKTGTTVESLSGLGYAAKLSEVPMDTLAKGLERLSKAMVGLEDSPQAKGAGAALAKLGISVKDATGQLKGSDQVFLEIADRFAHMKDGAEKTGLAMQIFGKSGAELIPVLNRGRDGLSELKAEAEKLGITLNDQTIAKAEEFRESLTKLELSAQAVEREFVDGMMPGLTKLSEVFLALKVNSASAEESLAHWAGRMIGDGAKELWKDFLGMGIALNELKLKWDLNFRTDQLAQARIDLMGFQDQYRALMGEFDKHPDGLVSGLFGRDPAKFDEAIARVNKAFPVFAKTVTSTLGDTGKEVDAQYEKWSRFMDLLAYTSAETDAVLKKMQGHRGDVGTLDKDLADVNGRIASLQKLLAEHPGELLPDVVRDLEKAKAEADLLKQAIEDASKPPDFKGQLPGGIGIGDIPINDPSKTGDLEKQAKQMHDIHDLWLKLGSDVGDQIKQAALYGRSWKDVIKTLLIDIGMAIIQFELLKYAEQSAGGGSGSGSAGGLFGAIVTGIFGGKKAGGGPVTGSTPYLVGEVGPELFVPSTSGTIIPNSAMRNTGGGGLETMRVELVVTSDTDLKIQRATARMRDQAIAASVALVRERQLRSI
jgi:hypothetical protein